MRQTSRNFVAGSFERGDLGHVVRQTRKYENVQLRLRLRICSAQEAVAATGEQGKEGRRGGRGKKEEESVEAQRNIKRGSSRRLHAGIFRQIL